MTGEGPSGLVVVKLGGSLAEAPELRAWLASIAGAPGPHLVVPGGGPFADAVRGTQERLGFDDLAAHRMAILAMQQYGLALASLEPGLRLVERPGEIAMLMADGAAGVWLPWAMIGRDPSIRPSWEVTSDSLALILATRLRAARLVLVKSGALPPGEASVVDLTQRGLIDPAFPELLAGFSGEVRLVHRATVGLAGGCRCRG